MNTHVNTEASQTIPARIRIAGGHDILEYVGTEQDTHYYRYEISRLSFAGRVCIQGHDLRTLMQSGAIEAIISVTLTDQNL